MRGYVYGRNGQVVFSSSEEFYYTLGFLADSRRAAIYWEHNEDQGAWGSEGRIHCLISEELFPAFFKFTAGRGSGVYARINCNDYVGCLVEDHKFKTRGVRQNVEEIMSTVPDQYRDIFLKGYGGKIDERLLKKATISASPAKKSGINLTGNNVTKKIVAKVGEKVQHKKFGVGVVKKISGTNMTVTFGKEDKFFQYPGAFEQGFLTKL